MVQTLCSAIANASNLDFISFRFIDHRATRICPLEPYFELFNPSLLRTGMRICPGDEGFLNYNSRMISASHVTLEFQVHGRHRLYSCIDFRADLISDYYVCDNRDGRSESLTVDRDLKVKTY